MVMTTKLLLLFPELGVGPIVSLLKSLIFPLLTVSGTIILQKKSQYNSQQRRMVF